MKYQPPFLPSMLDPVGGIHNTNANAPYVNGDPRIGQQGSIPPAQAIEHVQREIVEVITHAGLTPDHANLTQLRAAIQEMVADAVAAIDPLPVGTVLAWPSETLPSAKYAWCDGATFSRTGDTAALFSVLGITHGQGNGTTTANLPDYRGRVLRGWDNGAARDPDRASRTAMATGGLTGDRVGSVQGDAVQEHTHGYSNLTTGSTAQSGGQAGVLGGASPQTTATGTTGTFSTETRMKNAGVGFVIKIKA